MNSLSELNGFGSTSLTVTDDRPSKVIFDRQAPLRPIDQVYAITSTTVNVTPGINILEVINYSTANVRYRVSINTSGSPLLTGSTISWASLPGSVTLSIVGSTYTLGGIDSKAIWDQIKNFTWNLPANYATRPNWFLQVSIIYYDSAIGRDVTTSWLVYDEDFYYVAEFSSTTSLTCIGQDARLVSASLFCSTGLAVDPKLLEGIINTVNVTASLTCEARLKPKDGEFFAISSLSAKGSYASGQLKSSISSQAIVSAKSSVVINMFPRTYVANSENNILSTNTPFIQDETGPFEIYSISITSPIGVFSLGSTSDTFSTLTFSGTLAQCNNYFSQVKFYPNPNIVSNSTITFTGTKNGQNILNSTVALTYTSTAAAFSPKHYVFTRKPSWSTKDISVYSNNFYFVETPTLNWRPTNYERIYSSIKKVVLIGAGGKGGDQWGAAGGGGGGGAINYSDNFVVPNGNFTIVVGFKLSSGEAINESSITSSTGVKLIAPNGNNAGVPSELNPDDGGGSQGLNATPGTTFTAQSFAGGFGGGHGGGGGGAGGIGQAANVGLGYGGRGISFGNLPTEFWNLPLPNLFGHAPETSTHYVTFAALDRLCSGGGGGGFEPTLSNQYQGTTISWTLGAPSVDGGGAGGASTSVPGNFPEFPQLRIPDKNELDGEPGKRFGSGGGGSSSGVLVTVPQPTGYAIAGGNFGAHGAPGIIVIYFG